MAVLATEDYQPLLDSARKKGMTAKYVWITLDAAKGALKSDGVLIFSRQANPSITVKAFVDSWKADTTIYNKSIHGAFDTTTKMPLYDPNGPYWDTDYADVGDGVPDEWGMFVYDTVYFIAGAVQSLVEEKQDLNNGASLLGALKATRIDGVTGELRLEPETGDRKYLFDLLSIQCNRSSVGCTEFDTVTVLSQSDKSTDNTFIKVADIRWPAGFGSTIPDDGSLLEPSKCTLKIPSNTFTAGQTVDFVIDVATNFGEALSESAYLTLSLTKANASAVLATKEITVLANSTSITVTYVVPENAGAYDVSIFDKRTGHPIQGSPVTFVVGGTPFSSQCLCQGPRQALLVADAMRSHEQLLVR